MHIMGLHMSIFAWGSQRDYAQANTTSQRFGYDPKLALERHIPNPSVVVSDFLNAPYVPQRPAAPEAAECYIGAHKQLLCNRLQPQKRRNQHKTHLFPAAAARWLLSHMSPALPPAA